MVATTPGCPAPPITMQGLGVSLDTEDDHVHQIGLLAGQITGLGVGLLTMDKVQYTGGDVLFMNARALLA